MHTYRQTDRHINVAQHPTHATAVGVGHQKKPALTRAQRPTPAMICNL